MSDFDYDFGLLKALNPVKSKEDLQEAAVPEELKNITGLSLPIPQKKEDNTIDYPQDSSEIPFPTQAPTELVHAPASISAPTLASAPAPLPAPAKPAPAPQKPAKDTMQDIISSLKSTEQPALLTQQDLNKAISQGQMNQGLAAIALGGAQMAGKGHADLKPLEKVGEQFGTAPVSAVETKMKGDKQMLELATEAEKGDPNSAVSKIAQQAVERMGEMAGKKFDATGLPASSIEKIFGPIEKIAAAVDAHKLREIQAQSLRDTKLTAKQAQVTAHVDQALNGARAEPSVRLAEADAYNTKKITDIVDQYGGDLNKVTTNMVPVLIAEVAKVAKGGVPDKEELHRMMPDSVIGWLQKMEGKVLNEAEAAKAKGFLQDYITYAKGIQKGAQKTILDRYGRVLESNKNKMDPDDYDVRKQQYLGRFGLSDEGRKPQASSTGKKVNSKTLSDYVNKHPGQTPESAATFLKSQGFDVEGY